MPILIPIIRNADDAAHFTVQATLDDVTYTLEFRWNVRAPRTDHDGNVSSGAWRMNVLSADGSQAYMLGLPLVADYPPMKNIVSRTPAGTFMAIDTGSSIGDGVDPSFDDFGNRHKFYYWTAAEIAAVGG